MQQSLLEQFPALREPLSAVAEVAGYIWQKGWGERNGGNITLNVSSCLPAVLPAIAQPVALGMCLPHIAGMYFYAKGTQKRMRDLAREPLHNGCVLRITADGSAYEVVGDRVVPPTSELPSHLMVQDYLQQTGSRYTATLHTHPIELVALSHHRRFLDDTTRPNRLTHTLWSMIPETLAFAPLGIGIVPYEVPGSMALAQATLERMKDYDVALWEKHGVFAVGQDIMDAFDQVDVLNKAARIYLDAKTAGDEPEGMTDAAMRDVQRIFALPTVRPC